MRHSDALDNTFQIIREESDDSMPYTIASAEGVREVASHLTEAISRRDRLVNAY
jgi:hypothetical protein